MGKGGPVGAVTNAVSDVANAVGDAVGNVPVLGDPLKAGAKGIGQAVDASINGVVAVPKGIVAIAQGQNVFSATGEAVTGTIAGAAGAVSAPSVAVFNSVAPTGVQELPIVSNVESFDAASLDIANNQNYSSGALENFYRNGAELGAIAVTAGAASGAGAGADAGASATEGAADASIGADVGSVEAGDTLAATSAEAGSVTDVTAAGIGDGVSAGSVTATDIGADAAASSGSGLLGTAETVAASSGALTLGERFLGSKLPPLADSILGLPSPPQTGKTIVKPGANASSGGGGGGGGGGLGMTPAQASIIVAAGIAAVVIWKAKG